MARLTVAPHKEGKFTDLKITVHGVDVTHGGEVESQSDPTFVQFRFASRQPARLRVEIRSESAIVYREEVQLPPNGGSHDSGLRYFAV